MMKKILLTMLLCGLIGNSFAQQTEVTVKNVTPIKYEKRDGQLKILSYLKLNDASTKKLKVQLEAKNIAVEKTNKADSVLLWLPLIGENQKLQVWDDASKKPISTQMYTPPIPADWGYFKNGTIHIIQSSHQDVAWMNTPEYCRNERIEDIIKPALDMMKEDDQFTFEMEQTLNLMEFLERYPERKDEIAQRYKEKRFFWGATYNQPYEGLASGEQLVRQAYYGRKWIRDNFPGCDDQTANNIDVPGRTLQFPQIMAKSGIKNLFISRMEEGMYDWYSPDGSKVFTYTPGNYGWASLMWKFFDEDAVTALNKLHHRSTLWSDYFRTKNIPPHYAILMSCDATKPNNFNKIIEEWNWIVDNADVPLPRLQNSTAEGYFEQVNTSGTNFERVDGERPNLWLYIHGPAHYEATLYKREAGTLLPAAESFTTLDLLRGGKIENYPRPYFDRAWMASIYPDHGLGGKNGEITDQIFEDSLKLARDMGSQKLDETLKLIVSDVNAKKNEIVVFNDLTWERTDIASLEIGDSYGDNIVVKDGKGDLMPSQIVTEDGKKYLFFEARNIPSLGYKTFSISKGKKSKELPSEIVQMTNYYENKFYKVLLGDGGIQSLFDKQFNKEILETSKFKGGDIVELGYTGNGAGEFTRVKDVEPGDISPLSAHQTLWTMTDMGPLFCEYESSQTTKHTTVIQRVRLYHGLKRIDFDITLENFDGEHNRQYRITFPLNMTEKTINYEVPMAILEVGKDEMKRVPKGWAWGGTYEHHPQDTHPREIQNFISSNGNGFGFTMSSPVATADWIDPSREQANYPVLQGILISSHKSCHGEGNWYHQTGTHNFKFSVHTHDQGWENGYHQGIEFNHPLRVVKKEDDSKGTLDAEHSFVSISDPFVSLSLMKKCDYDNGVIIRLTEMQGKDTDVSLTFDNPVKKVIRTNLIEEELEAIDTSGNTITLPMGHHAIETFKLIFD